MSLIASIKATFANGGLRPEDLLRRSMDLLASHDGVVIHAVPLEENLARLASMQDRRDQLPLFGLPFVIKDNIDLAGHPTTAACPGYAYTPEHSAFVVQRLLDAGAIPLAKVNLDQFATGLVGVRSPYGVPANPLHPDRVPGGSSSGSAVAVSIGAAVFALGTDTAGSGRVPAAACNIVGLKPSKGRLSTSGVVPACRSLDCVSIFATSCHDAAYVCQIAGAYDDQDSFARLPAPKHGRIRRLGLLVGDDLQIDDPLYGSGYSETIQRVTELGLTTDPIDYQPFARAAALLYEGPWVAERSAAVGQAIADGIEGLDPTVSAIISGGTRGSAIDAFVASYQLADCRRAAERTWSLVDAIVLPSVPGIPTIDELAADPIGPNSRLGTYTNWVNLLDCCAVTIPVIDDQRGNASVTLVAPAWQEDALLALAHDLHRQACARVGAGDLAVSNQPPRAIDDRPTLPIAVIGAHLAGQPLHHQLTERQAIFSHAGRSAPTYRLLALEDQTPIKPGMYRVAAGEAGASIALEVYHLPLEHWGSFIAGIPAPLGIGLIELDDGSWVHGFVCEASAAAQATDISAYGGWLAWLERED